MNAMHQAGPTPPVTPILLTTPPRIVKRDYLLSKLGGDGTTRFIREIYASNFPHIRHIPTDDELDTRTMELLCKAREYEKYLHYQERAVRNEKIWPNKKEFGFLKALLVYPPVGKKTFKVKTGKLRRGRNELIAEAVEIWTGKRCHRKQVSSHLQVLKPKLAGCQDILFLLGAPGSRSKKVRERNVTARPSSNRYNTQRNSQNRYPVSPDSPSLLPSQGGLLLSNAPPLVSSSASPNNGNSNSFAPVTFSMYINNPDTQKRIHTFSVLATPPSSSPSSPPETIEVPFGPLSGPWAPLALATGSSNPPSFPVVFCEGSLTPTMQYLPAGAQLSIDLQIRVSPGLVPGADKYRCRTVFFAFGESVVSIEKDVGYDPTARKLTDLPFCSGFWASKVSQLRPQKSTAGTYEVKDLTAVQIISSVNTVDNYSGTVPRQDTKEPLVALVWHFSLARFGEAGSTSWYKLEFLKPNMAAPPNWYDDLNEDTGVQTDDNYDNDDDNDEKSNLMDVDGGRRHRGLALDMPVSTVAGDLDPFGGLRNIYSASHSFPSYMPHVYNSDAMSLPTGLTARFSDMSQAPIQSFISAELPSQQRFANLGMGIETMNPHSELDIEASVGASASTAFFEEAARWHNSPYDGSFYTDHIGSLASQDHVDVDQQQHGHLSHPHFGDIQQTGADINHRTHMHMSQPMHVADHHLDAAGPSMIDAQRHAQFQVFTPTATSGGRIVAVLEDTADAFQSNEDGFGVGCVGVEDNLDADHSSHHRFPIFESSMPTAINIVSNDATIPATVMPISATVPSNDNDDGISGGRTAAVVAGMRSRSTQSPHSLEAPLVLNTDSFAAQEAAEALQRALGLVNNDQGDLNDHAGGAGRNIGDGISMHIQGGGSNAMVLPMPMAEVPQSH